MRHDAERCGHRALGERQRTSGGEALGKHLRPRARRRCRPACRGSRPAPGEVGGEHFATCGPRRGKGGAGWLRCGENNAGGWRRGEGGVLGPLRRRVGACCRRWRKRLAPSWRKASSRCQQPDLHTAHARKIEKLCMAWGTVGAVGAGCAVSRARIVRSGMRVVCALVRAVGVACMVAFKHGERSPR